MANKTRDSRNPPAASAGPVDDVEGLRRRITELEVQVADLTPKANAYKAQRDDLGRQKAQADEERLKAIAECERATQAQKHFEAERERLLKEAEAFVGAERALRLQKAEEEIALFRVEADQAAATARDAADEYAATTRQKAEQALRASSGEAERLQKEADAALGSARKEAASHLAEVQKEAASVLADARKEAGSVLAEAKREAARIAGDAPVEAQAEAERLRSEARADARRVRDEAEVKAGEALEVARAEAASLLGAARKEAAHTLAAAETEKAGAEAARLVADRRAAERIRVEEEAARSAATAEEARIKAAAQAEANARIAAAKEREDAVSKREGDVYATLEDVERREAEIERNLREISHREGLAERREEHLDIEEHDLAQRRAALAQADARVGAATAARLTEEREEARSMLEASRKRNLDLALERDRLARTVEDAGGVDLDARMAEVEKLRARVRELLVERGSMAHVEEIAALREENARLQALAGRVADAEKRARELERAQAGVDHAVALARDEADRKVATAQSQLERQVASTDRIAAKNELLVKEHEGLQAELAAGKRALDDARSLQLDRDWLEARVRELERTLEDRNRLARQRAKDRYGVLAQLDESPRTTGLADPEPPASLRVLADRVREGMASDKDSPRFYDQHTVRAWIASLAAHRMIVLQGLSGTGKTSLPLAFAKALGGFAVTVPVQSGWRDKADLFGFYNTFDHRFRASDFTAAVYASNGPDLADRPVFVILDECNLSRVEYYMADLLSELELDPRERGRKKAPTTFDDRFPDRAPHLLQVSDQEDNEAPKFLLEGRYLALPRNVWIIGTANEDESTFELADKTLDRAGILQMDGRATPQKKTTASLPPLSWSGMTGAFDDTQGKWAHGAKLDAWIEDLAPTLEKRFEIAFGNRFGDQGKRFLPVYEACGGSVVDGLDHLLQTRILRRVRRLRDPGRVKDVEALREDLMRSWRVWGGEPQRSLDLIKRVLSRLGGRA
jgi:hypothetical protein